MASDDIVRHLLQLDNREEVERIGAEPWVTLYASERSEHGDRAYFCALVSKSEVSRVMSRDDWDLMVGSGRPGFSTSYQKGRETHKYHRFGGDDGILPFVFHRSFDRLKPDYIELLEEFRHLFNLYHDVRTSSYIRLTESGEDETVVEVSNERIRIKTGILHQFLAVKHMHLAVFFDFKAFAPGVVQIPPPMNESEVITPSLRYSFFVADRLISGKTFSRLLGKRLIAPESLKKIGFGPYEREEKFVDFIIGTGSDGKETLFTCNPEKLGNYFGKNKGAPHSLTPVVFRREVLKKYYDHPEKYEIEDGLLRCGGRWILTIDNDSDDRVTVFLGDLGQTLAYQEQIYWRSFNIAPLGDGRDLSNATIQRSFHAEFTDPESPELVFKDRYTQLLESWERRFGWQLFRTLRDEDAHVLQRLRVPLTPSKAEFEDQVLGLTKLLVDSLNDSELARELGGALENEKGISKLERFLVAKNYPKQGRDIGFLRLLQEARSAMSAHRKGGSYAKVAGKLSLSERPAPEVFSGLLKQAIDMLSDFQHFFLEP